MICNTPYRDTMVVNTQVDTHTWRVWRLWIDIYNSFIANIKTYENGMANLALNFRFFLIAHYQPWENLGVIPIHSTELQTLPFFERYLHKLIGLWRWPKHEDLWNVQPNSFWMFILWVLHRHARCKFYPCYTSLCHKHRIPILTNEKHFHQKKTAYISHPR